jgi:hypothetical protein
VVSGRRHRILLVSSSGGTLLELLSLRPWWSRHDVTWAVVRAADTRSTLVDQRVVWIPDVSAHRLASVLPAVVLARRIVREVRPELVVSAGAGAAVPLFLVARACGVPSFWISTRNLLTVSGTSGQALARLATRVLLQQPSLWSTHRRGLVIGQLY